MIFDIDHGSLVDGPGIRTAVFFKGCNLRCSWCHNPESQSFKPQLMVWRDRCIGCGSCACQKPKCDGCGACVEKCPTGARKLAGREVTAEEIMAEILEDRPFYGTDGGVTFTGGECMLQPEFLLELLKRCKEAGIHTAVDTAGHHNREAFEKLLPYTDLFLYDIKHMEPETHRKYTGVRNEQILENLGYLLNVGAKVWVRIPMIPGVNDSPENMEKIEAFLSRYPAPEKVEKLPYHTLGDHKYTALGLTVPIFGNARQDRKQ